MEKLAGVHCSRTNACRNLHKLLDNRTGLQVPIPLEVVQITIRRVRPLRCVEAWWPQLTMRSWLRYLIREKPQVILGGALLNDTLKWQSTFSSFWESYRSYNPSHPVFQKPDLPLGLCVPYFIHGDEGRTSSKKAFMVLAWRPVVSHLGLSHCNDST